MNSFYLVQWGGGDFDYSFLSTDEWQEARDKSADGLVSCKNVDLIRVKDEVAVQEWQAAYDEYVRAAWTPNQSREDRQENVPIIAQSLATMKRLESEARIPA